MSTEKPINHMSPIKGNEDAIEKALAVSDSKAEFMALMDMCGFEMPNVEKWLKTNSPAHPDLESFFASKAKSRSTPAKSPEIER